MMRLLRAVSVSWAVTLATAMALSLTLAVPAQAQSATQTQRKATGTLSEPTYRQLERVHELIAKKQEAEALKRAQALLGKVSGDYEKAVIQQTLGFIYVAQNNYKEAIKAFEASLALEALPQQPYEQMLFNVAQLYFQEGKTDQAISRLEQYLKEVTTKPNADVYILLASAYADRKRYKDALPQVDKAIASSSTPKESWLQLKLALHYELKQFAQCAEVLTKLITLAPIKQDYWKQLSSVLFEIKRDKESLAVLALAERQGFLKTEGEVRNLANVYLLLNIPLKAARVLEQGIERNLLKGDEKTLTQIGDAYTMARNYAKAEGVYRQAAQTAANGELYFKLAQIFVEDERWADALPMLQQAQSKGVKKPGEAAFLEGVAAFNKGDRRRALTALRKAQQYPESRNNASQWINHIAQIDEADALATRATRAAANNRAEADDVAVPQAPAAPRAPTPPVAPVAPAAPVP
ncbi:tetratricopeptide repeat protein [Sinimarinibacterium sp. NLF-5-8]|uniref:tetratricopeptide repeat protein n=1 Tax=Sinimarinibacterium sp. NLF-5-8 TaxID=2698684 RepID=UPI00137C2E53|nr:tetratricopeptide repeat protein [Sinimarinibacterium sp. NLF-5-8]QHS11162.1 tetratricopeptide repeat protein [Sinimarinibacterium sp. NLF-5-8]